MTDTKRKDVLILAIESSCDETAAAVVKNGREVLSNVIYSQIDLHTLYGGVVPEIASRKHIEKINQVVRKALADAKLYAGRYYSGRSDLWAGTGRSAFSRCGGSKGNCICCEQAACRCASYRGAYQRQLY